MTVLTQARPTRQATSQAFVALLLRDLTVLRKEVRMFLGRTIMQPLLLIFVFTYVFPKIGQGIGGSGRAAEGFSTLLVGGVIASAMIFQGIQAVALPLVFSLLVIPMTFLGCVYYPWQTLEKIVWLKWAIVVNPLVYLSEGLRYSLAKGVPHMPIVAIYIVMAAFTAVLLRLGIDGFRRRVLA